MHFQGKFCKENGNISYEPKTFTTSRSDFRLYDLPPLFKIVLTIINYTNIRSDVLKKTSTLKQIFKRWKIELSLPRYVIGFAFYSSCFIIIIIK